jgi:raffinose/stachyose/melibiose transport system permease protein
VSLRTRISPLRRKGSLGSSPKPGVVTNPKGLEARKARRPGMIALAVIGGILALVWLSPFWFVAINSFKEFGAILKDAAGWPNPFILDNYPTAWESARFVSAFMNSLIITAVSVASMILIGALAAWRMARMPHRVNKLIFFVFVSAMIVPFQTIMIPIVQITSNLNILNTRTGLILVYIGLGMPLTVFFLHGFVSTAVPKSLEEAAMIDGASPWQTFRYIVLPLLRPMLATLAVLHTFWIWNDFLLPLLVIFDPGKRTIPLAIFQFFGRHANAWDLALATLVMGIVPVVIFFLAFQKHIIRGVSAGSVKG